MKPISKSLTFWTLLVGVIVYIARFFVPTFPLTEKQLLDAIVFLLGAVNVTPTVLARNIMGSTWLDLIKQKSLWVMIAALADFVLHYYLPTFPLTEVTILALLVFILSAFNINVELEAIAERKQIAEIVAGIHARKEKRAAKVKK